VAGASDQQPPTVLRVRDLRTHFFTEHGVVRSVEGVSFDVPAGRTLAVVGESGSGKSVTSLSVMGLLDRATGRVVGGEIVFSDRQGQVHDLLVAPASEMRRLRGNDISMIFQEPMTSLNPVLTVGEQISEAIVLHQKSSATDAHQAAIAMLRIVGIPAPEKRARDYPHQMSGGMRQRVMVAMALCCRPSLLIADEPTTALDVTIQAQILDLMRRMQREIGMAILFVTHDLGVVAEMADQVVVMYAGTVVEQGDVVSVLKYPAHPYTIGLLGSIPGARRDAKGASMRLQAIPGTVPDPRRRPRGCLFAPRCAHAIDACRVVEPAFIETAPGHSARCIRLGELNPC
jgi:oligopeptide/dipeptide ABC transporter ATP-binding protein